MMSQNRRGEDRSRVSVLVPIILLIALLIVLGIGLTSLVTKVFG